MLLHTTLTPPLRCSLPPPSQRRIEEEKAAAEKAEAEAAAAEAARLKALDEQYEAMLPVRCGSVVLFCQFDVLRFAADAEAFVSVRGDAAGALRSDALPACQVHALHCLHERWMVGLEV